VTAGGDAQPPGLARLAAEALRFRGDPAGAVASAATQLAAHALHRAAAGGDPVVAADTAAAAAAAGLLPELSAALMQSPSGGGMAQTHTDALWALAWAAQLPGLASPVSLAVLADDTPLCASLAGAHGLEAQAAAAALVAATARSSQRMRDATGAAVWTALGGGDAPANGAGSDEPAPVNTVPPALLDAAAALCDAAMGDARAAGADAGAAADRVLLADGRLAALVAILRPPMTTLRAADVLPRAVRVLALPLSSGGAAPQLCSAAYKDALLSQDVVAVMAGSLAYVPPEAMAAPMSLLCRLVLDAPALGHAFVKGGGLSPSAVAAALSSSAPAAALADALLLLSQLARVGGEHMAALTAAGLGPLLNDLLKHSSPVVRARAANATGNLCRHGDSFYAAAAEAGLPAALVSACTDSDGATRKFACFALGNAAFHSDALYGHLAHAVAPLVKLLADGDDKTRANAAGALGNLVRNSGALVPELMSCGAPEALMRCVRDQLAPSPSGLKKHAAGASSEGSSRIALFSLGNLCSHAVCNAKLQALGLRELAASLVAAPPDSTTAKYAQRVITKLDATIAATA